MPHRAVTARRKRFVIVIVVVIVLATREALREAYGLDYDKDYDYEAEPTCIRLGESCALITH